MSDLKHIYVESRASCLLYLVYGDNSTGSYLRETFHYLASFNWYPQVFINLDEKKVLIILFPFYVFGSNPFFINKIHNMKCKPMSAWWTLDRAFISMFKPPDDCNRGMCTPAYIHSCYRACLSIVVYLHEHLIKHSPLFVSKHKCIEMHYLYS